MWCCDSRHMPLLKCSHGIYRAIPVISIWLYGWYELYLFVLSNRLTRTTGFRSDVDSHIGAIEKLITLKGCVDGFRWSTGEKNFWYLVSLGKIKSWCYRISDTFRLFISTRHPRSQIVGGVIGFQASTRFVSDTKESIRGTTDTVPESDTQCGLGTNLFLFAEQIIRIGTVAEIFSLLLS